MFTILIVLGVIFLVVLCAWLGILGFLFEIICMFFGGGSGGSGSSDKGSFGGGSFGGGGSSDEY
jgi:hypothetical protein